MKYPSKAQVISMTPAQRREHYRQMAVAYQEKHGCRWSEACLEIKRRFPESRASFGAPPKEETVA